MCGPQVGTRAARKTLRYILISPQWSSAGITIPGYSGVGGMDGRGVEEGVVGGVGGGGGKRRRYETSL